MVQFIHQNPNNLTLSDADRRVVRKVSNRAAAATRKAKGTTARTNALQLPDFLVTETKAVTDPNPRPPPARENAECIQLQQSKQAPFDQALASYRHPSPLGRSAKRSYHASIASPLSLWPNKRNSPEYVSLLMQPGLSQKLLLDASSVGINSDPRRWVKICRLTTILQFLPRMIGHSQCLDYAIDCLAERVRQCCVQSLDRELALTQLEKRYGRALQCLQNALNSSRSIDWTVWYTTLLLTLFELLDNSGHHAWILHSQGAKHILLTLGPNNIKTEFKKILLAAQCQIMTVEATFINQDCFLSSPAWQQALRSTITQNGLLPDRSESVLTMWMMTTRAPELYRRSTEAILHCHPPEQTLRVAAELCALIEEYSKWREKWEAILVGSGDSGHDGSCTDEAALTGAGPTIYPIFLAFWALTNRFLVAIQPSRASVAEANAINAALRIIEFDRLRETDSVTDLCRTFSASIARSIKLTNLEWSVQQRVSRTSQTIEPRIFLRWCTLLGRATE
ncbi:uncharacterized protein A1O5_10280 [Cladophialophora psammophila CBS 110553]|uniref:Transcription factor domain-containing protein n=1 Tax=Cladophialophora psammophila CBS 110553 TaxID=1182543 RepID=W9X829_9EURO|nr:uncharacterized protein A1O5_10280 [Cladophialophora psammophila CBS 110553]EXJ66609.1 hypothetical protein A1O5_10280 [Cladophialophora psammophila CBS 110553]